MSSFVFSDIFKRWGMECTSSQSVSKFTFFQAKRSRCLSSSSVFGAGSLYVVSSTIIQKVSRVFTSRKFAGRSSFSTKFANSFDTMPEWSVHRLFSLQGLPTFFGHISPYGCTRNVNIVKLTSFCLWIITQILTAFSIIFFTKIVKNKRPSTWCSPWIVF